MIANQATPEKGALVSTVGSRPLKRPRRPSVRLMVINASNVLRYWCRLQEVLQAWQDG